MEKETNSYNWSDAWLLLSIIHASKKRGATLNEIIEAGDAINISIFTPEEMESGLSRLTAGGYIEEKGGAFSITEQLAGQLSRTKILSRYIRKQLEDIRKLIGAASWAAVQPNPNNLQYPGFSKELFEEAYKRYVDRVANRFT
jgi:hypothetical protein